jgi:hypothetical protein
MSIREVRLLPRCNEVLVMAVGMAGETRLKARLPMAAVHPRAAIGVLEGLALWCGRRLPVAVGVTASSRCFVEDLLPAGPAWCSPLVELFPVDLPRRRARGTRLDGVGDFRAMRSLALAGIDL